jgi:uncharacterized protein YlxW (UPF0749 family)
VRGDRGDRRQGLVLPAILLLLGFLVSAAVVRERTLEERLPARSADLLELVRRRQGTIAELSSEVDQLAVDLTRAQRTGARESSRVREALARVEGLRTSVGLAPVRGPGVVVELSDSPDAPRTTGEATDLRIQDVDLRLVVNALWAAGAEAVAVNERRVATTTAIRHAGRAILVNFHPVSPPYRVAAIGDAEGLHRRTLRSDIAGQFGVWTQVYGLGFAVRTADSIVVPGLSAPGDLTWARPVGDMP